MSTHFNFPKYSKLLATLIQDNLQNNEKPIVIGIHGEWGSGKTTLLEEIAIKTNRLNKYRERQLGRDKNNKICSLIIPIFFNAWRFEKEEHLIIPLLKTLYYELEKRETLNNNEIYNALKYVKDGLFSIIAGLEFEIGNATVGKVKYSPKNSLEYNEKKYLQRKEEQKSKKFSKRYESTYFDIINKIEALSKSHNENDVNVKFLFLIDDLDRCLPENTVKMLESIKLFLDIPNCAFVLAVDKEVVELGVEHHYRAYKDMKKQLPITGSEYLEKMITLPFALPSIQKEKIKEFITQHQKYKTLFTEDKEDELLNLFCNTVPAIPRKIIRSLDLYDYKLKLKEALTIELNNKIIALMTLLELFLPLFYRYVKKEFEKKAEYNSKTFELLINIKNQANGENKSILNIIIEDSDIQGMLEIFKQSRNKFNIDLFFDFILKYDGDFQNDLRIYYTYTQKI